MIRCLHCHAETTNGLALCDLCQRYARSCLEYLPVYFRNLARWRPGRTGSRQVPGSRVLYDGTDRSGGDRISDTLDETANALTTWARVLVDARPQLGRLLDRLAKARAEERVDEAQMVAWLCKGFDRYLTSIATTDWCGEFLRGEWDEGTSEDSGPQGIGYYETRLRKLTETAVPGWYAGECKRCETDTYVVPGLTWVTCGGCGVTTYARDHLGVVLDEARDWVAPPKRIAEAVVALVDTEPSVPRLYDRIRRWANDDALVAVRRTARGYVWDIDADRFVVADEAVGPARYRLGDVLALILRETTRAREIAKNTAAAS